MQSVTVGQCFRGAWKDAGSAILNRPVMALIMFAFLLLTGYAQLELRPAIAAATAVGGPRFGDGGASLGFLICLIMQMLAIAGLSVQVMRYSLLGAKEARSIGFFDKGYWRYFGLCVLLSLLLVATFVVVSTIAVAFTVQWRAHHSRPIFFMSVPILLVIVFTAMFIWIRLSLLFCHAAIGARAS